MFFTKYAEEKFDILNKHKIYFTREQIEEVVLSPDKEEIKDNHIFVQKDDIKVVYRKENNIKKIITFYPIKK
jgi:hypothetical protein